MRSISRNRRACCVLFGMWMTGCVCMGSCGAPLRADIPEGGQASFPLTVSLPQWGRNVKGCHGTLDSLGRVWSETRHDRVSLFGQGLRMEAADRARGALYVIFSPDSARVELFGPDGERMGLWNRRKLPSGEWSWGEDDDGADGLRYADGRWTVSRCGQFIYVQQRGDNEPGLGPWAEVHYEGMLPSEDGSAVTCSLSVRHRRHSGDGRFQLRLARRGAGSGADETFVCMGRRNTQRGVPADANAVVWQLVPDRGQGFYNFLLVEGGQCLVVLDRNFEKLATCPDCILKRME